MRVVIIEDEWAAQEQLKSMLNELIVDLELVAVIGTVSEAVEFLSSQPAIDLLLMDIHLSDGNSFEIFNQVKVSTPIIFTTAYDQYAIQAFKQNSIDYLLKPIVGEDLEYAIEKFRASDSKTNQLMLESIYNSLNESKSTSYKNSFLIQKKDRLYPVEVDNIAAFYIEDSLVKFITYNNEVNNVPNKLDELEAMLNPTLFFRANRQYILSRKAIEHLSIHFNGKLKIKCKVELPTAIIVSRLKSLELKAWLNI